MAQRNVTLADGANPSGSCVTTASASLFRVTGARPVVGTLFGPTTYASEGRSSSCRRACGDVALAGVRA